MSKKKRGKIKHSSSIIKPIGKPLSQRIPKNKRYRGVKGKVDSGMSINKIKKKLNSQSWNKRYKKKENFRRIKRFHLQRIIETYMDRDEEEEEGEEKKDPFVLLLDIRPEDLYAKCHVLGSKNYPHRYLSRSTNPFIIVPEMYKYKNAKGRMIVVYDYEEELGRSVCQRLFQLGFDNVALLSGGLKRFAEKYSHLLFGTPPKTKKKKKRKYSDTSSIVSYATTVNPRFFKKKKKKSSKFDKNEQIWK